MLVAPDKRLNPIFFLFLHENICYGYSLEVPQQGTSNEYIHLFWERNKKNINTFPRKKIVIQSYGDVITCPTMQTDHYQRNKKNINTFQLWLAIQS